MGMEWAHSTSNFMVCRSSLGSQDGRGYWAVARGRLDVYITMIPEADGDSTPHGQWPSCVHPAVFRLGASVRFGHIQAWFTVGSLTLHSVLATEGVSSVDAWSATTLDIEDVLSGACDGHVHVFVADVIKSFDLVVRGILDCAHGCLVLLGWFRRIYFAYHARVRLRFKSAAGVREVWTLNGGIPQGTPLSIVFIVALYFPWCRYLAGQPAVTPSWYADNLECTNDKALLLGKFFFAVVGQEASPCKCVLLGTSITTRRRKKHWTISSGERCWAG